jgi:hypothetical protein
MNKGVLPKSRARDYYASHVAGIFRMTKYGPMPAALNAALDKTSTTVPLDVDPITSFGENVR